MRFWKQVWLLMWKNFLIQRRRICVSIFLVLLPAFCSCLIMVVRRSEVPHIEYYKHEVVVPIPDPFPDYGFIGYTPASNATEDVMNHVLYLLMRFMPSDKNLTLKGFQSEEESVAYYRNNSDRMQHIIVFHGVSSSSKQMPKKVSFSIRPHLPKGYWYTGLMFHFVPQSKLRERETSYKQTGVLYLQTLVGEALARYWIAKGGGDPHSVALYPYTKLFPFPSYDNDYFAERIQTILPLCIVGSFIFSVIIFTMNVVVEKQNKLKESMRLMGLTSTAFWTSWYLTFSLYLVPFMGLFTLMMKLPIANIGPVLYYSSGSLLLVLLLIYAHTVITFCFMISTFVTRADIVGAVSGILYFVLYFVPSNSLDGLHKLSRRKKLCYSLVLNTGFGMAMHVVTIYEKWRGGASWGNFYQRSEDDNSISILECMMMMLVSSIIHLLITWYMDNIRPGEFGVPKPYTFCFKKSHWSGAGVNKEIGLRFDLPESKYFEEDPTGRVAGIRIFNLRKVIRGRVAVAGTSLNMYNGQITVLLGQNGAGKTTTMSMITGFIPPTSGTAIVNGYDIRTNKNDVRRSLGLCLQHDVLFDMITVSEHFRFYAKIKGYSSRKFKKEILQVATKLGLQNKINTFTKDLSGGQRRKLSVAIALIGESQVVILDEPTSGLDSDSRHHIWSVLQEVRQGRTIMLITNSVYEADLLGDRIAIMVGGVIKCCGSPVFLKKLYGVGHHLIVVIKPGCDIPTLTVAIQSIIPQATLKNVVNTEVIYLLPDKESGTLATLSEFLNTKKAHLLISSFGTTPPTMEVFLNLSYFSRAGESIQDDDFVARNVNKNMAGSTSADGDLFLTVQKKWEGDASKITETIRSFFPKAEPTNISSQSITYLLPENDSDQLPALCKELEYNKGVLKIINFSTSPQTNFAGYADSASSTTVDYVYNPQKDSVFTLEFNTGFSKKEGMSLELSRITGVFVKKVLLTWRNRINMLIHLGLPFLFTLIIVLLERHPDQAIDPPLTLNIVPYRETYIPYTDATDQFQSTKLNSFGNLYKRQFCSCHNTEYVILQPGDTFDKFIARKVSKMSTSEYIRKMIIGMEVRHASRNDVTAIAYFNNHPIHSEAISVNYLMNTMLQFTLNSSFSFKSAISPLPRDKEIDKDFEKHKEEDNSVACGVLISSSMSFTTALFIASLIREKQTKVKHMQIMTGMSLKTYWVGSFLWDFVNLLVTSLIIPLLFEVFEVRAYTGDGRSAVVVLVLVLFCWAMLSFIYLLQFMFTSPARGVDVIIIINFVSGVLAVLEIARSPGKSAWDRLLSIIFPNYNLACSFRDIYNNYHTLKRCLPRLSKCQFKSNECCKEKCGDNCLPYQTNYLSMEHPGIGWYLTVMAVQGLIFFLTVTAIEYDLWKRVRYAIVGKSTDVTSYNKEEDSDVAAERERIDTTPVKTLRTTDQLVLMNLYQRFHNFTAVDHICVGIKEGECFGLLGQNFAGKTTTLRMIMGDTIISGGNVYLKGFSIRSNKKQVQANIGYCPQMNSLLGRLTGREMLTMFARLRGVPEDSLDAVVVSLASRIKMTEYLDDFTGKYSDGNKRKLCTAIALIGDPPFLILDEPTSGLDHEGKRNTWAMLSRLRASGRTIVLATQSAEECEALCARLAIMVNGRFMCLGSPQHLKNKFGQGYNIITKLGKAYDGSFHPSEPIIDVITSTFPGSKVFDKRERYIYFQVPQDNGTIEDIFEAMDKIKHEYNLQDYSVQQTTLEQVFLSFMKTQITAPENTQAK